MTPAELLPRVKARLGDTLARDEVLMELIQECLDKGALFAWVKALPRAAASTIVKWAVAEFNSLGIEGETGHTEGGIARAIDGIPADVAQELRAIRRGGAGLNAVKTT